MAIPAATMTLAAIMRPAERGWLGAGLCGTRLAWMHGEAERELKPVPASRLALAMGQERQYGKKQICRVRNKDLSRHSSEMHERWTYLWLVAQASERLLALGRRVLRCVAEGR